ncbi:response regulator [Megasphaera stantonii]|uniref:response regulator n=1 Tax=Megasphaera stantonii TaxID=2144175 RepID=UPI0023EFED56|nr:response regulator [Megasphaera stantonii]
MIQVLIIEDDPMVAEINTRYLRRVDGFDVMGVVKNGLEALDFLEKHQVDLILLDVFMPKMDGITFLIKLKAKYPEIDVIMITAAQSKEHVKRVLSHGVIDYIIKPFTFERLKATLLSYMERRKILQDNSDFDQSILDAAFFKQRVDATSCDLPKGIEKQTFDRVKYECSQKEAPFSTQEIADAVGISRISIRKYLNYMETLGLVHGTLTYRPKGRPIYMYTYCKK